MNNCFRLHIFAAEKILYDGPCESLIIPTVNGKYGVLANHCDMVTATVPGVLKYRISDNEEKLASISEGLVKIEQNEVWILVDSAEDPENIDEKRAEHAAKRAREAMKMKQGTFEYYEAKAKLARAQARLSVKTGYGRINR